MVVAAKFRARRKQHVNKLQRQITDLEDSRGELTREVGELRNENGFLRVRKTSLGLIFPAWPDDDLLRKRI